MVTTSEIQHTRLKGELVFQDFCLRLIRHYWQDDYAEAFGRSGQNQRGVDIVGRDNRNGYSHAGMQCKASETDGPRQLGIVELAAEVEKAKKYRPHLDILIVAYAGERDVALQQRAQEISADHARNGMFRVVVWSWPDMVSRAQNYPDVARELLVHNQVAATTPVLNPARPLSDPTSKFQAEIASAIEALRVSSAVVATKDETTALDAKLDVFRDQIRTGGGPLVVENLRALLGEISEDTPGRLKLRIFGNLGAALAQIGDFDGAEDAFAQAGASDPETAAGQSYRARAALLQGLPGQAFTAAQRAVELDPSNLSAANIFIESAPATMATADLELKIAAVAADIDVASSLQRRFVAIDKDFDASIRVARAIAVQDWRKDAVVAQAILSCFEDNKDVRVGAPVSTSEQFLLEESRTRLARAWGQIKTRPDRRNWTFVAANLCAALRLTGRDDEADAFSIEVHSLEPQDSALTQRCIFAHMHRNNVKAAYELATGLAGRSDSNAEVWFLAASVSATHRKWEETNSWAQKAFSASVDEGEPNPDAATLLILSVSRTETPAKAIELAKSLRPRFPTDIGFEAQVAEIARRAGDEPTRADALARLRAFSFDKLDATERFELADALADDADWSGAATLLDGLYQVDRPSEPLRRRLFYLYRADERSNARELFGSLGPAVLARPEILRLGAAIYERSGLLDDALKVLETAVKLDTADLRSRLDWVRIAIRAGHEGRVSAWIKKTHVSFDGNGEELIEFAQILNRYGRRRDALRVGFEALAVNWGTSERLHMGYLSLFLLQFRKDKFLHVKIVREDTVVYLENDHGEKVMYLIGSGSLPGIEALAADHAFAKSLIGKNVGATVLLGGIGQPVEWKVAEITHKFVALFRRALDAHGRLFPQSRALGRFTIDIDSKNAFEPIFEQARERARLVSDAVEIYSENLIPIDTVAKALGSDPIDTSRGLRFQSGVWLDSCVGDQSERQQALENLEGQSAVIVDALTLALWQEIEFIDLVEGLPITIHTVQATIDELAQRAEDAHQALNQEGGSLEAHGDGVVMVKSTLEQRQALREANNSILAWVRVHTKLLPTSVFYNDNEKIEDFLSSSTIDTIATARETGMTMISEDRRIRLLAAELGVGSSSWTQPFLLALRECKALRDEDYVRLVAKLYRQRIGFVSVGPAELLLAIEMDADVFSTLAETVTDARVDVTSLVPVASEVAYHLWTQTRFVADREIYFSKILNGVLQRPGGAGLFVRIAKMSYEALVDSGLVGVWRAKMWERYMHEFARGHFIHHLVAKPSK
ncbi:conserved hypothetical protein (plasmid) [Allorhizobium ampelinum S4]|uniref:PIN domain-containing protein n=1 Tax=Allorhizobium ampelinum (strain ATCC BAA-846 / DSM 112012 / S4) TaxID=311402 RepID=B9K322_ALLAM|nr:tetratricopeptide repeat protein [Allorhizobium ampelinum]ACM39270.1 conserved hypothetical protein [Allorhizobium ampelinum S4]